MTRIGLFGGGQLGRMLIRSGHAMGHRFLVYDPSPQATASRVADNALTASYDDTDALARFVHGVDVVSFEFENVPIAAANWVAERRPLRPRAGVLEVAQDRVREKCFLRDHGFEVVPFREIRSPADLEAAMVDLGLPAVLKTARSGYDGKGQLKITEPGQDAKALLAEQGNPDAAVLEAFVPFQGELSVITARGQDGDIRSYPVFENLHQKHILHTTVFPARVPPEFAKRAKALGEGIAEALDVVGLLTVELFWTEDDQLWVNELAPRPHNSGHLTIEAARTSQFEQHVRAIVGWPLGDVSEVRPAVMVNLLGDLWAAGEPDWVALLRNPAVKLHLYDKGHARPGRKMGHMTLLGKDPQQLLLEAEAELSRLMTPRSKR